MYEILIHTRECPQGFVFEGFLDDNRPALFPSEQEARKYASDMSLAWRWNGYCTIRKREEEKAMDLEQKQKILSDVKTNLEDFLYNTFVDIPQTLGGDINEMHEDILSTLLTEIAKTHHKFYVDTEED